MDTQLQSNFVKCLYCGKENVIGSANCYNCGMHIVDVTKIETPESDEELTGIKGWLLFAVIRLILNIISSAFTLNKVIFNYDNIIFVAKNYIGFITSIIDCVINIAGAIFLTYYFFKRKKFIPKYYIYFIIITLISLAFSYYFMNPQLSVPKFVFTLIIWAVVDLAWIFYFLKSVRVKNTFVVD